MRQRTIRKIMRAAKNGALILATLAAGYLVFVGIGIIDLPYWDISWLPVQGAMVIMGMAWIALFAAANSEEEDCEEYFEEEDGEEEEEEWPDLKEYQKTYSKSRSNQRQA